MIFVVTNPKADLPYVHYSNANLDDLVVMYNAVIYSMKRKKLNSKFFLFSDYGDPLVFWFWKNDNLYQQFYHNGKLDKFCRLVLV